MGLVVSRDWVATTILLPHLTMLPKSQYLGSLTTSASSSMAWVYTTIAPAEA